MTNASASVAVPKAPIAADIANRGAARSLAANVAFALGNLPLAALTVAMAVYLPRHFATHVGVSLAAVGSAFAMVRAIDIGVDLLLGLAMDRTRTPLGRYRAWMIAGAPVLMLATFMLFIDTAGMTTATLVVWLLVLYLGTSILALSHAAWAATLVSRYEDRAKIFGLMAALGVAGSAVMFLTPAIVASFGAADALAVPTMGWVIIVATPLVIATVVISTTEHIREDLRHVQFKLSAYWDLVCRPTVLRILMADFFMALGPGWLSATMLFVLIDAKSFTITDASVMLAISISAGFLGAPLMSKLAAIISKHRALMVASICYAATIVALVLTPGGQWLATLPTMFAMGFSGATFTALIRAMTADISDELRLDQGQERAGLLFAIITLTTKAAGAFSIFLTFQVLDAIGYDAKAGSGNTPDAILGLQLASVIGPTIFLFLGAACCIGYKLTPERHNAIRIALAKQEAELLEPTSG